jgi:hypothetical protein
MENQTPSSLLISAVNAICSSAMRLKRSKKEPFTCLILFVRHDKRAYDIVPVYSTNYELSVAGARQQVVEQYDKLFLYVIVADGTITREGVTSDAMVIEACEVGQGVRFSFIRRYTPPKLFSKAHAEETLTLTGHEPERVHAAS